MTKQSATTTNFKSSSSKASKVPRPMNCFMTYRLEKQREIVERCPGANHRDISKIIAKWWKELPAEEKEPYRIKAEQAKKEHSRLYPNYKFCPQKKTSKPRAYKKRPENQFTARDYHDEQELFRLYHDGKDVLPKSSGIAGEAVPLILDPKEPKPSCKYQRNNNKKASSSISTTLNHEDTYYSNNSLDYPQKILSSSPFSDQQQYQSSSSYNTGMLYPPITAGSLLYPGSVYSQSVYSPIASPYTTGQSSFASPYTSGSYSSSEEPNHHDVNYKLHPAQYGYSTIPPPPITNYGCYGNTSSLDQYYGSPMDYQYEAGSPIYEDQSCRPLTSSSPNTYTTTYEATTTPPALLTSAFYYRQ